MKEDVLLIVGNGFDLAHGIKSSYTDFKNYLLAKQYEDTAMIT